MKLFLTISLLTVFSFSLSASVTHIWPQSGTNDTTITAHIFGDNFNSGVSELSLNKSSYTSINATNISVINDNYLTCDFNLTGFSLITYNLTVNSDTLDMCFTVNPRVNSTGWIKTDLGSSSSTMHQVAVGDGNNDGVFEVYGACLNNHIYQFKWNGTSWNKTDLGSAGSYFHAVAVGDGNDDGELEVYGGSDDNHIYQFKWNGSAWIKTTVGSGSGWFRDLTIGDGNNDGELEVYGPCDQAHTIYQFKWNGSTWNRTAIGSTPGRSGQITVGDGNNDGELEVYAGCANYHIYQYKYNGSSWNTSDIGLFPSGNHDIKVADGNNNGSFEVYTACVNHNIYKCTWTGSSWNITSIGNTNMPWMGVVIGDGNNDGYPEVFGANHDNDNIYQFKWNSSGWDSSEVGSANDLMFDVGIGDGDNDGLIEVYGASRDNHLYQFKVDYTDTLNPQIDSTTIWNDTTFTGPFTIDTKIIDNFLMAETLYYKRTEDPNWNCITLSAQGGNWFSADIPIAYADPDTVKYYIYAKDNFNNESTDPSGAPGNFYSFIVSQLAVEEGNNIPEFFNLSFSNPFNNQIIFDLSIPYETDISLKIFDLSGREISTLISGILTANNYQIPFTSISKGVYFYRLECEYLNETGKLIIVE